jgi:hypothetical protein
VRVITISTSVGDLVMLHGELAVQVNNHAGLSFRVQYA